MNSSKKTAILNLFILTFILVANNSAFAHQEYSCSHDHDDLIKETQRKLHEYFKQNPINYTEDEQGRNLGSQTIQPIRITTDFTRLSAQSNGPAITTDQINYLTSVSTTVVNFVSNFIKVQPNPTNNIFNPQQTSDNTCITVVPSQSDQSTGIPNSDLHLYFIFNSDPTAGYLANAGFCNLQQTSTYMRPNFGRVLFNIANMKNSGTDLEQFQNDVMVTLHEVIHILGFSYGAMQNWYNKATKQLLGQTSANQLITTQTLRGISTKLLGSPNVLATAQKYYGCQTLQGMQLENQGGSGSLNSHWERTIIRSEIMTASALTEGLNLTFFTVALLKDTGYWDDVNENLTDPIYWGRGKGCDFFQNSCQSSTQYEEFVTSGQLACSFWDDGQGIGSNSDPFGDSCNVVQIYSNFLCSDIANQSYQNNPASFNADTSNDFSYNSKCFASTVVSPTAQYTYQDQNFRCHFMQCSPDKTQITITFSQIPSTQIVCGISDQSTKKDVIYQGNNYGQVTCPSNIARLCDDQQCVNFCTYNGICIRGQCLCNPGFGGVDCSKQCNGYFDQTGNCVSSCPSNTFASTDNVCRTTCPNGTYQDSGSGLCKQCDFSCSQCTGPSNSQCKACQLLTYLSNGSCVTTCPTGQYADETSKTCSNCPDGCSSCTSYTNCTGCKTGYTQSSGACSDSSCTGNCATCSSSSKSSCLTCTSNLYLQPGNTCNSTCPSGYYQNSQNMTCTACSTGCKACSDGKTCTQCDASSGYRQQGNSCTLCASTCATCSSSNPNSCQSCENSLYLFNNQCVVTCQKGYYNGPNYTCSPCVTGCDQCSNGNSCTTCSTNYQPFTYKNQQICINSSSCFSPCSTCSGTFQPTTCATCNQSFYLQGTNCVATCNQGYYANQSNQTCVQCPANCSVCSDASTCTSCSNNYFLSENSCVQTCPQGQTANSNQVCFSANANTFAERNYFALMILILMIFLSF